MPSAAAPLAGPLLEVACDESGSEGEKLVRGSTDTFAHASVEVAPAAAVATIERVRVQARSPATEVKAGVVLRPQNRRLLEWLLGDDGPLLGHAHVHLTDKALHLTERMLHLLPEPEPEGEPEVAGPDALARARTVHRAASERLGREGWLSVLSEFNDLVRAASPAQAAAGASSLACRLSGLDGLLPAGLLQVPVDPDGVLRLVARGRGTLDPIVPALADALRHWSAAGRPLWVVHDVQSALTDAAVERAVARSGSVTSAVLRGVSFVDSHDDPRVQLADFLAGAVRRIASQVLAGEADAGLVELVAPYVSERSTWLGPWLRDPGSRAGGAARRHGSEGESAAART